VTTLSRQYVKLCDLHDFADGELLGMIRSLLPERDPLAHIERQVRALAREGDVFLAISTSGRSPNILRALDVAREAGAVCLGFAGQDGGVMAGRCEALFRAPARETPIVQQLHITAAHLFCALVERGMFPDGAVRLG